MGAETGIAWCDATFNPWIGCTKVSDACTNCYAEALMDTRWGKVKWGAGEKRIRTSESNWREPLKWNKAAAAAGVRRRVFCASLADVFDVEADPRWREELILLINDTPHLDWLLLTKRPQVAKKCWETYPMPSNIWLGTTVEDQKMADLRVPILLSIPARIRFLSCEPLLGPIDLTTIKQTVAPGFFGDALQWYHRGKVHEDEGLAYPSISWVIVGGESGSGARQMPMEWAYEIRNQCIDAGVFFFMKQMGGHPNKRDRLEDFPAHLRVREFPA